MNRKAFDRLHLLRMENTKAGYEMDEQRGRFNALADRHENGTAPKALTAFNLFQTPESLVCKMIDLAGDLKVKRILEPSAGLGRIYRGIINAGGQDITLIEENPGLCSQLYNMTEGDMDTKLLQRDFLQNNNINPFDIILMNPPFKMGRDIKHILHAREMLKPGGLLVAICANGPRQNRKLFPLCESWEVLPGGTFKAEGTNVSTVLLSMRKART